MVQAAETTTRPDFHITTDWDFSTQQKATSQWHMQLLDDSYNYQQPQLLAAANIYIYVMHVQNITYMYILYTLSPLKKQVCKNLQSLQINDQV
jgi:hypothetical protein